jgi:ATP-binding cassette subfamily B (MDR/TAP) protein 1
MEKYEVKISANEIEIPQILKNDIIERNVNNHEDDDDEPQAQENLQERDGQIPIKKEDKILISKRAASFFRLQYSLSTKKDNLIMGLGLFGSLCLGLYFPLFSIIFGDSINSFGSQVMSQEKFMSHMGQMSLNFFYVGLAMWIAGCLMIWLWGYNGKTIARRIKEKYFHLILSQEQGWFDQQNVNEFASKIQSKLKIIEIGVSTCNDYF